MVKTQTIHYSVDMFQSGSFKLSFAIEVEKGNGKRTFEKY